MRKLLKVRPGTWGWAGLAFYVLIIDTILLRLKKSKGNPYCSLSEVFGDSLKHPRNRWPIIVIWLLLTAHLFGNLVPSRLEFVKKMDPIGFLARRISS